MKGLKLGLFAAVLAALLLTTTAQAGIREGAFTLSPMVGYYGFEGDQKTEDGLALGFSVGYNVSKRWAAELEARYVNSERENVATQEDLDMVSVGMNALYHFNPDGKLVPYLSAGFGVMFFDWGARDNDADDEDYMMNWGLGAKYFFNDSSAIRADLRHIVDLHSDRNWDHASGDDVDHNYLATVGLFFQFGGVVPPIPPADSDGDGIPDIRDKCPDTPLGVMVDAVGCPPVEKALSVYQKPVDGDDDGDGVLNSKDKCPGTERGIMVDEFGCPIKFTLQIEFDFDKDEVRPQYHDKLRKAADFINKYPGTRFLLAGHTDSRGSDEYNEGLSMRRAAAVKKYLVEKFGIAAQTLNPKGYGEKQPVDTNATDEGRQRNRRVEVILLIN